MDTFPQGYLISVDSYMNVNLANTEEYIDGVLAGTIYEVPWCSISNYFASHTLSKPVSFPVV